MKSTVFKIIYIFIVLSLVLWAPCLSLYIGIKKQGIDFIKIIASTNTLENFYLLLLDNRINFINKYINGIYYSTITAIFSVSMAILVGIWLYNKFGKKAIGLAFSFLALTLLPSSFFIIPTMWVTSKINIFNNAIWIIVLLFVVSTPFAIWLVSLIIGNRIEITLVSNAIDGGDISRGIKLIIFENLREIIIILLIMWALVWGNYSIPYSLGDNQSYTAVTAITSFNTNIGRNWAMICAASFLVCLPGLIASVIIYIAFAYRLKNKNSK